MSVPLWEFGPNASEIHSSYTKFVDFYWRNELRVAVYRLRESGPELLGVLLTGQRRGEWRPKR